METPLDKVWSDAGYPTPTFTRTQVAKLLNCTQLTIANREKKHIYPDPKRSSTSNHRIYTLQDAFLMQYITFKQINLSAVASLLWDKGYTQSGKVLPCIEKEVVLFKQNPSLKENIVATDVAKESDSNVST